MTFNDECRYLDRTRMESDRMEKGLVGGGKTSKQRNYHPCLSEENPDDWVSECPEDCPYFQIIETE